ncbi:axin interactor, dorsalization-associated protein-like [Stylophora pistillata]|uniref:axin interactor, dorsalization-associated protein-like n=1 Tax=Stylophora pistillata TaxID=50429 RepID=UPI000C05405A|nr:axin interactor, dorsalization-associated protein-like [Stylophora pistillata]
MTEKSRQINQWYVSFEKGKDFDSWGQLVEAAEEYSRLARDLKKHCTLGNKMFQEEQKKLMLKMSACFEKRSKTLLSTQARDDEISFDDIKKVGEVLRNLNVGWNSPFPVRIEEPKSSFVADADDVTEYGDENGSEHTSSVADGGSLLPRIPYEEGVHRLVVRINQIGLKDAHVYINPFFTVSVKDANSVNVTPAQDTPISNRSNGKFINFDVDVEIQKPIEKLPRGTAIFFEFKHYKPKKDVVSTRCFAFMEQDEFKPGPACIELYQKPTDFHRKRLNLFTQKPLYLHLTLKVLDD